MALWAEFPSDVIVALEMVPPEDSDGALGRALRSALEEPMVGKPRFPPRMLCSRRRHGSTQTTTRLHTSTSPRSACTVRVSRSLARWVRCAGLRCSLRWQRTNASSRRFPTTRHRGSPSTTALPACRCTTYRRRSCPRACDAKRHRRLFALDAPEPVCEVYTDKDGPAVRLTIPYEAIVLFDAGVAAQLKGAPGPRKRLDPIPSLALTRGAH